MTGHYHDDSEELSDKSDVDSLFDANSDTPGHSPSVTRAPDVVHVTAQSIAPSIPGLFFDPSVLISSALARELEDATAEYFRSDSAPGNINQVMLFGRASATSSGLPSFLDDLVIALSALLKPHLPAHAYEMLFPSAASASRQAIMNHYTPGEGITPHIDLLTRFADGIVAVSLGSGTVMAFQNVSGGEISDGGERFDIYLPERSVLVLTGDARFKWSHGIEERLEDCIENGQEILWVKRGTRISITLRWLLPGADIVGGLE